MDGVLVVNKPAGWTSHDVVAVARGALGIKRVGHGGTLDPLATGLLPVLVGRATRFVERLHQAPKVYAALVVFGHETTTDDREGETRRSAPVPDLGQAELDGALDAFRGETLQVPPARSAIKVEGRRAYALDRAGETVTLEPRVVRVDRLAVATWRPPSARLLVVCGSGTYVRSLARDIGRAVGSAAHLGGLRRLAVGSLTVAGAMTVPHLREMGREALLERLRPSGDDLLALDPQYLTQPATEILGAWEET